MAKKVPEQPPRVDPLALTPAEQKLEARGTDLYNDLIVSLGSLAVKVYPVAFDIDELKVWEGKVFVRRLDCHEQLKYDEISRQQGNREGAATIIYAVLHAACAADGTPIFPDPDNEKHVTTLIGIPEFSRAVWLEAMCVIGYYSRINRSIAKNSTETLTHSSDSDSQSNSEEQSENSSTAPPSIGS